MQQSNITVLDGTLNTVAPEPRRGLAKLVYQVVKELGGASTHQIKKYLPAVTDDVDKYINTKKFDACLYSCVYSGYLITDGDKYRIAPKSYFDARQVIVANNKDRHLSGSARKYKQQRKHPAIPTLTYLRPFWHWITLTSVGVITGCVGFLIGLLIGLNLVTPV